MNNVAVAYRVLAYIVGVSTVFVVGAFVAKLTTDDFSWWNRNTDLIGTIDMLHGFLFMGVLVLIAVLARRYRWEPWFIITTMLLATIPFVSFWAERRATQAIHKADASGVSQETV